MFVGTTEIHIYDINDGRFHVSDMIYSTHTVFTESHNLLFSSNIIIPLFKYVTALVLYHIGEMINFKVASFKRKKNNKTFQVEKKQHHTSNTECLSR